MIVLGRSLMKLLIVNFSQITYGANYHLGVVLKALSNFDRRNITLSGSSLFNDPSETNFAYKKHFYSESLISKLFYYFIFLPFYTLIKNYDVVYVPWGIAPFVYGKKVIVCAHNPILLFPRNQLSLKSKIFFDLYLFSLRRADIVKTPSKFFANLLNNKFSIKNVEIIYHGVNLSQWLTVSKTHCSSKYCRKYIVFWSYFHKTKNIELLLNAFAKYVSLTANPFHLYLSGKFMSKGYRNEILSLTEKLAISKYISFSENTPFESLKELISFASGIILPFDHETFCYPFVESRFFDAPIGVLDDELAREITQNQVFYLSKTVESISTFFLHLEINHLNPTNYSIDSKFFSESEILSLRSLFQDNSLSY